MRRLGLGLLCASAFLSQASASIIVYSDSMFGSSETPPNFASSASGSATVTINTVANTLAFTEGWFGLASAATGSFIGVGSLIAVPFSSFPATTGGNFNNTSSPYNLTLSATYSVAFLTANGGTAASAESALLADLAGGTGLTNIVDATFPNGEIAGQLTLQSITNPAPEPGTLVLGTAALLLFGLIRRRRAT